jgi:hypothetical protein
MCISSAAGLVDYIISHQGEGQTQLLRAAVQQMTTAEAQAYDSGWSHGYSSAAGKHQY